MSNTYKPKNGDISCQAYYTKLFFGFSDCSAFCLFRKIVNQLIEVGFNCICNAEYFVFINSLVFLRLVCTAIAFCWFPAKFMGLMLMKGRGLFGSLSDKSKYGFVFALVSCSDNYLFGSAISLLYFFELCSVLLFFSIFGCKTIRLSELKVCHR